MGTRSRLTAASCATLLLTGCAIAPSFTDGEKREMRETTSDYQQAVLEDLVVTETEYRDAVDELRSCVQDKGWGVGPLEEHDGNQLGFQSSYGGENAPSNEDGQACDDEFMTQVGPIWVSQRTPLTQ